MNRSHVLKVGELDGNFFSACQLHRFLALSLVPAKEVA